MNVLLAPGLDEDATYELRAHWNRFIDSVRQQIQVGNFDASSGAALRKIADEFVELVGREFLTALSADYEHGNRLLEVIDQTFERIAELLQLFDEPVQALSRFSEDGAVRIMTIHKSKGLEFDTVVMLGIEKQTFWGKREDERSAFFVGISRAKRRLYLTVAEHRDRPEGHKGRWDENRTPDSEFLNYATGTS
jgi:superfamily I DNA/RNA helicase